MAMLKMVCPAVPREQSEHTKTQQQRRRPPFKTVWENIHGISAELFTINTSSIRLPRAPAIIWHGLRVWMVCCAWQGERDTLDIAITSIHLMHICIYFTVLGPASACLNIEKKKKKKKFPGAVRFFRSVPMIFYSICGIFWALLPTDHRGHQWKFG